MVALTLVTNASRAVPTRQSATSTTRAHGVGAKPAFVARRHGDACIAVNARSRNASHRLVIARAGGEGEENDEENERRAAEAEVEVVEDDEDEDALPEHQADVAPPTRLAEIMAKLQEALDSGTGGDVLAELLPELTSEVSQMESAFEDIRAANAGLEDRAVATKDQYLRLTADFENFKKRTVKEKQQLAETVKGKVFEAMLPALDNFDLAKTNLKPESEEGGSIMKQFIGLHDGLMTILSNQGLTAVEGVGTPFDPTFHEAILREESEEPEDVIIEEFRKGYKMGEDTLVRASMVKVSAGPAN